MALAHIIENRVEARIRRGDLFEKRRRLMIDWLPIALATGPMVKCHSDPRGGRLATGRAQLAIADSLLCTRIWTEAECPFSTKTDIRAGYLSDANPAQ